MTLEDKIGSQVATRIKDEVITGNIRKALYDIKSMGGESLISVSSRNRVVILTGYVPNMTMYQVAQQAASSVWGVMGVINKLSFKNI